MTEKKSPTARREHEARREAARRFVMSARALTGIAGPVVGMDPETLWNLRDVRPDGAPAGKPRTVRGPSRIDARETVDAGAMMRAADLFAWASDDETEWTPSPMAYRLASVLCDARARRHGMVATDRAIPATEHTPASPHGVERHSGASVSAVTEWTLAHGMYLFPARDFLAPVVSSTGRIVRKGHAAREARRLLGWRALAVYCAAEVTQSMRAASVGLGNDGRQGVSVVSIDTLPVTLPASFTGCGSHGEEVTCEADATCSVHRDRPAGAVSDCDGCATEWAIVLNEARGRVAANVLNACNGRTMADASRLLGVKPATLRKRASRAGVKVGRVGRPRKVVSA